MQELDVQNVALGVARSLLSAGCCPECGAPLTGETCEYCGAPAPEKVVDKAIEIAMKKEMSETVTELKRGVAELRTAVFSILSSVSASSARYGVPPSLVIGAIRTGGLEELWKAAPRVAEDFESFDEAMKRFVKQYRRRKFREAVSSLSRALLSMKRAKSPISAVAIPFPLFDAVEADVNGDRRPEVSVVPEITMRVPSFVLSEGGKLLEDYLPRGAVVIPLSIEDYNPSFAIWENPDLLDVKVRAGDREFYGAAGHAITANFFGDGRNDVVLATNRGPEIISATGKRVRAFTGTVSALHAADVDGDGSDELLVVAAGKVLLVDYDGGLQIRRLIEAPGSCMLASSYFGDDVEHAFLMCDRDVYSLDEPPIRMFSLPPEELPLGITRLSVKGKEFIAIISYSGSLRMRFIGESDDYFDLLEGAVEAPIFVPSAFRAATFSLCDGIPSLPGRARWFATALHADGDDDEEIVLGLKDSFLYIKVREVAP